MHGFNLKINGLPTTELLIDRIVIVEIIEILTIYDPSKKDIYRISRIYRLFIDFTAGLSLSGIYVR